MELNDNLCNRCGTNNGVTEFYHVCINFKNKHVYQQNNLGFRAVRAIAWSFSARTDIAKTARMFDQPFLFCGCLLSIRVAEKLPRCSGQMAGGGKMQPDPVKELAGMVWYLDFFDSCGRAGWLIEELFRAKK